jgi:hypothetical protein
MMLIIQILILILQGNSIISMCECPLPTNFWTNLHIFIKSAVGIIVQEAVPLLCHLCLMYQFYKTWAKWTQVIAHHAVTIPANNVTHSTNSV